MFSCKTRLLDVFWQWVRSAGAEDHYIVITPSRRIIRVLEHLIRSNSLQIVSPVCARACICACICVCTCACVCVCEYILYEPPQHTKTALLSTTVQYRKPRPDRRGQGSEGNARHHATNKNKATHAPLESICRRWLSLKQPCTAPSDQRSARRNGQTALIDKLSHKQ